MYIVKTDYVYSAKSKKSYNRYDYYKDYCKITFVSNSMPKGSVIIDLDDVDKVKNYYFTVSKNVYDKMVVKTNITKRGFRYISSILFPEKSGDRILHKNGNDNDYRKENITTRNGSIVKKENCIDSEEKIKKAAVNTSVFDLIERTQKEFSDFVKKPSDGSDSQISDNGQKLLKYLIFGKVKNYKRMDADDEFINSLLNQFEIYCYLSDINRTSDLGCIKNIEFFDDFYTMPAFKKSSNEIKVIEYLLPKLLFDYSIDVIEDSSIMNYYQIVNTEKYRDGIELLRDLFYNDNKTVNIEFLKQLQSKYYQVILVDDSTYGITTFGSTRMVLV